MGDATTLEQLAGEQYIRLTTFRRSSDPVHTAVWHVVVDGVLYVHTGDQTGKAKRLRANGRAEIAPSDARGRTTGGPVPMVGAALNGEDPQRLESAFRDKYGWQYRAVGATSGLRKKKIGEPTYFGFHLGEATG